MILGAFLLVSPVPVLAATTWQDDSDIRFLGTWFAPGSRQYE